tara:strand:+ start:245 stop:991 length:747 start_codon:yes stop_codon:yes gene_type:complete
MSNDVSKKEETKEMSLSYNPLTLNLKHLEIKDKTVENYFEQIKSNFYTSVKAHYLIARDLYDAQQNLHPRDYASLVYHCNFSGATQRKYIAIGKDVRLMSLFIVGKLPMKWTSQYLLTQLDDKQFKKVEAVIQPDTTAKVIKEVAELNEDEKEKIENNLLSFLQVEVDKTEVSITKFKKIVDKIKSALSSIPEITINDDKVETAENRIVSYYNKMKKEKEAEEKRKKKEAEDIAMAKAILAKASAVAA